MNQRVKNSNHFFWSLWLTSCLIILSSTLFSQPLEGYPVSWDSVEEATLLLEKLQNDDSIPATWAPTLKAIKKNLSEIQELKKKVKEYDSLTQSAPEQTEFLKQQIASVPSEPAPLKEKTLSQLEQDLSIAIAEVKSAQDLVVQLEGEPQKRALRRMAIPEKIANLQQEGNSSSAALDFGDLKNSNTELIREMITWSISRLKSLRIQVLEKELTSYEARSRSLPLRRDLSVKNADLLEDRVKQLSQELESRRRLEAETTALKARLASTRAHPALAEIAEENSRLADLRTGPEGVLDEIAQLDKLVQELDQEERRLRVRYEELKEKVDVAGLTNASGLLLQKEVGNLPNLNEHHQEISLRKSLIPGLHLKIFNLQEKRDALSDRMEETVQKKLKELSSSIQPENHLAVEQEVRSLLAKRIELYDGLLVDFDSYFSRLVEVDTKQRHLVGLIDTVTDYVDERLLWVRGASPLSLTMIYSAGESLGWFFRFENWRAVSKTLILQFELNPAINLLVLVFLVLIYIFHGILKRALKKCGLEAQQKRNLRFFPTVKSLVITLTLLTPLPLCLLLLSSRLQAVSVEHPFPVFLGSALVSALYLYVPLDLMRLVCRKGGLGEAHFQWSPGAMQALHRRLSWVAPLIFCFSLLVYSVAAQSNLSWKVSLGAWTSIAIQGLASWLVFWSLKPDGVVLRGFIVDDKVSLINRIRFILRPLLGGYPIALIVVALFGWTFGAMALSQRYLYTLLLLIVVLIFRSLALCWVRVQYRQVKLRAAQKRLAKLRREKKEEISSTANRVSEDEIDMTEADRQLRRILSVVSLVVIIVGLWALWADVMPAMKRLNNIHLWERSVSISNVLDSTSGATVLKDQILSQTYVTLNDLLLAVFIVLVTFTAARNLPGLLEMTILRRFKMDPGLRFALVTFYRYLLAIIGMTVAFGFIGIGWSKVQWLAAAVSVGLGFGLQEIFANFVSGMIILMERPIRIGDIVTVGETSGRITQIRMRATVITDWDRRELLVPNKEFVTGRLINWTLTDPMTRIDIDVGVAYGSDTEKARAIMKNIAANHEAVAKNPEPFTSFLSFGDSSLLLRLYAFLPDRSLYLSTVSDIRTEIDKQFKEVNITIAFPQLDVHVNPLPNPRISDKKKT